MSMGGWIEMGVLLEGGGWSVRGRFRFCLLILFLLFC
jgi:hypothetical protein